MGLDMRLFLLDKSIDNDLSGTKLNVPYPKELDSFAYGIEMRNFTAVVNGHEFQIGFWRKFYTLHNWFVRECSSANAACKAFCIPLNKVKELISVCQSVLEQQGKSPADAKIIAGFFSADREHSDDYFIEVKYTKDLMEKIYEFVSKNPKRYKVIYHNAWQ